MSSVAAVGVDVGASTIKAALVEKSGQIAAAIERPTPEDDARNIVDAMVGISTQLQQIGKDLGLEIAGVGFGLPNYSVGADWVQTMCGNMPALEGYPLRPPLQEVLGNRIACDLDTHAATLAELRFGAAIGCDRLLNMVIGTGISCGIAIDGEILRYAFGTSGDTGHTIVDALGTRTCTCGGRGCLETYAGAWAIRAAAIDHAGQDPDSRLARLRARPEDLEARDVAELARGGDEPAQAILAEAGMAIGVALTTLIHIFCPHLILIGGGVAGAGEYLLRPARTALDRLAAPFYRRQLVDIRLAALGANAGAIGAALPLLAD